MQSTLSLPFLFGLLWPGVVAPDRVVSMGQIEQIVCKQMTDVWGDDHMDEKLS